MLKPALRRVWRDESTLQLGLTPAHAVILSGLTAPERSVLALLDGSRDVAALVDVASANGVHADVAPRVLRTLSAAQVLDDATLTQPALAEDDRQRLEPDLLSLSLRNPGPGGAARILAMRQEATVAVHGTARVGATVATLLAAAGIGTLLCVDREPLRPGDLAPGGIAQIRAASRGASIARRIAAMSKAVRVDIEHRGPTTLTVIAPSASGSLPELLEGHSVSRVDLIQFSGYTALSFLRKTLSKWPSVKIRMLLYHPASADQFDPNPILLQQFGFVTSRAWKLQLIILWHG